jgi:4-hydroxybenzoate polyprenyltransferase
MDQTLKYLFETARPRQWLKNLSLFTGLVFSGWLFIPQKFLTALLAVLVFSILASSVYIFNDLIDANRDRKHPLKKKRPIASGKLPAPVALFVAILLAVTSLVLASKFSFFFFLLCLSYATLHFAYSLLLKTYAIIDVLAIASGFVIRVYAGAVAVNAHINVWLLLCVVSFSLFLAIGKRRSEKTLLERKGLEHREVLTHYPDRLLDIYTSMFANTTWLTYALFAFQQPTFIREGAVLNLMAVLPKAFVNQKLLMVTVPFVIYGVMRYLQLIYDQGKGESPAEVLLADRALLTAILIWFVIVVGVMYGIA